MSVYALATSKSAPGAVGLADGANLDAFSRLRVSTRVGLFDSTFQYDLQPLLYYQTVANSGTIDHTPASSSATLSTAAVASSSAILQSKQYHRYIPAKSQLVVMTQVLGAATANVVKRVGYFDASDGIFLEPGGARAGDGRSHQRAALHGRVRGAAGGVLGRGAPAVERGAARQVTSDEHRTRRAGRHGRAGGVVSTVTLRMRPVKRLLPSAYSSVTGVSLPRPTSAPSSPENANGMVRATRTSPAG